MSGDGTTIYDSRNEQEILLTTTGGATGYYLDPETDTLISTSFILESPNNDNYGNGYFISLSGHRFDTRTKEVITLLNNPFYVTYSGADKLIYENGVWVYKRGNSEIIYSSKDDGISWSSTNISPLSGSSHIFHISGSKWIVIDRYSPYEYYVSTDNASSFIRSGEAQIFPNFSNSNNITVNGILYDSGSLGVFRSSDEGRSWVNVLPDTSSSKLFYANGLFLYSGTNVSVSFDGLSWSSLDATSASSLTYSYRYGRWFSYDLGTSTNGYIWTDTGPILDFYPTGTANYYTASSNLNNRPSQSIYRTKNGIFKQTHTISEPSSISSISNDGVNACSGGGISTDSDGAKTYHLVSASNVDRLYETQSLTYPPESPFISTRTTLISGDSSTLVLDEGNTVKIYKK
jgi:hypothetical protein